MSSNRRKVWIFPVVILFLLIRTSSCQQAWKLLYEEDFSSPLDENNAQWFQEDYQDPFDTIMDDAGDWYRNDYGPAFTDALNSFHTYRKEFTIGSDGWLTASLSTRDSDKDGSFDSEPTLQIETIGGPNRQRNVLKMTAEDHTGGVILRPTKALPEVYRIEYKLTSLDFGGKRAGSIVHPDGKINGYNPVGCKTQHPWGEGSQSEGWSGDASASYCDWQSVRTGPFAYNGFHFLAIVDFANPAPRNNHFWHYRRKVLMDSFSQHPDRFGTGSGGLICNANTLQYYNYSDSISFVTLNMWISGTPGTWTPNPGTLTGSRQRFITDCNGGKATQGIQSAGELLPPEELEEDEYYTFAIERNASGYILEASGRFQRVEYKKYRFFRPFVEDEEPIWHYNVNQEEYDGSYNGDLRQTNWDYGSKVWTNQWPAGSAYPDYFVIGDLYTNVYEGTASITDIRLYVPDADAPPCSPIVFLETDDQIGTGERVIRDDLFLYQRDTGSLEVWSGSPQNPGSIFWHNGVNESIEGALYHTKLQGDGNLITWRVDPDGSKSVVWKSSSGSNPDGLYSFVAQCESNGGGVALYRDTISAGNYAIWNQDGLFPRPAPNTPAPQLQPTSAPRPSSLDLRPPPAWTPAPAPMPVEASPTVSSTEAPVLSESCEEPVSLMVQGEVLYTEEQKEYANYYLYQDITGNLELWEGSPEAPGRMLWESGQLEATIDVYYTTLQGDGNLVTIRVTRYEDSPIWQSGTGSDLGVYRLVLVRCEDEVLAIKNEWGQIVWSSDLLVPLAASPTTQPTEPPTKGKRTSAAPLEMNQAFTSSSAMFSFLVFLLINVY